MLAFALVGSIGFIVDAGLLTLLSQKFGLGLYVSRLFSFTCATLVTWLINRVYTFRHLTRGGAVHYSEYLRYVVVQVTAAFANLAVFVLVIEQFPATADYPVLPLAVGAVFGMVINFLGARYWVYPAAEAEL
ncbi:MAG: GtrA family protein [Halioglobus sp.]|nr:GtrA family protein [Halioglobus sp.]